MAEEAVAKEVEQVTKAGEEEEDATGPIPIPEDAVDLSGDGGVFKKILRAGEGPKPKDGYTMHMHYVGRLMDNGKLFDSSRKRDQEFLFRLHRGQVIKSWDIGVASMNVGELALLWCRADYAYGEKGHEPQIPKNATLVFEVELLSFDIEPESVDDRILLGNREKDKGNQFFKESKFNEAAECYKKGLGYFEKVWGASEEDKSRMNQVALALHLNLAACKLKTNDLRDAILECEKSLDIDENNVKAYFRRGQANARLCEYTKARGDFEYVLQQAPNDAAAKQELARLNKAEEDSKRKEKKVLAGMFAALSSDD